MNFKFLRTTILLITLLLSTNFVDAQISSQEIDDLVIENIEKFNTVGIAVGIVKDGEIIYAKGFGVKSLDSKKKVDKNTAFGIGSNSKAFTTTALAILVDEGKLKWNDKVTKYIPEFKMYNSYVTENFTIEDLLTHRSGLGLGIGDLMIFPDGSDFTMEDIVSSFQYFKPTSA
ncbi:MAG: beta-lactamase family protein, partial [Flavobacteriales bacterium]|nr:beta-lactamase family protein [Flavobacteriales bacterium]